MTCKSIQRIFLIIAFVVAASAMLAAQVAQAYIDATPPEAQIFVDGKNWGTAGRLVEATPGTHTITVYNYGFAPQIRDIVFNEAAIIHFEFKLQPAGDRVSGPWGRIQIEDAPSESAVFLNGKTVGYLVGHSDLFNHNTIWRQQLVVPAGKHQVTVVARKADVIWSGEVEVPTNKRVIVHTATGEMTVKDWPEGSSLTSLSRFNAGLASASVAVAPVTAKFTAEPTHINCGDTTRLTWMTQEAVDSTIAANSTSLGELPVSGEKAEQPKQTTNYQFKAAGPGGIVTADSTVEVNTVVEANMGISPAEVVYHRMGDKVVEHTPTNLNWTSLNADAASIDPIGTVTTNGDQSVKPVPRQATNGPVDENVTYTFTATNICGGSGTQTANVHITGMIEPVPEVPLASVFFPTGYPGQRHPQTGLVRSQHDVLAKTAEVFKKYLLYDPGARITLTGHADLRGPAKTNQSLSERRANRVKACLASQGVPEDKIDIVAVEEQQNLDRAEVLKLQEENPHKARITQRSSQALVWAYNRRVDISLLPAGQTSTQFFPGDATDATLIFHSRWQNRRTIEEAEETTQIAPTTGEVTPTQQPATDTPAAPPPASN
jgi:hypothetical protein